MATRGVKSMSEKLKISKPVSDDLDYLSRKLDLRRNIICRLAVGKSLTISKSVRDNKLEDNNGYEFNKYTLTGDKDVVYKALIIQHEKKSMNDEEYITKYLRKHIERGIVIMKKIN